jgi:uncharacterized repeat protein (TIGR01451 family)
MESGARVATMKRGWWRMLVTLTVIGLMGAFGAGTALADAPNPINGTTHGEIVTNPNGTVTVFVRGEWNWLSHNNDCNEDRAGAGLGLVWNDPTEPGYLISKNGISAAVGVASLRPGDTANMVDGMVHPSDRGNVPQGFIEPVLPPYTSPGFPSGQQFNDPAPQAQEQPHPYTEWKGGCGREPLKGVASGQFEGHPWGSWGYEKSVVASDGKVHTGYAHTYAKRSDVTKVCVNFYDVHGGDKPGNQHFQLPNGTNEIDVIKNNDNSIETNKFEVNGGSCVFFGGITTKAVANAHTTESVFDTASITGAQPTAVGTVTFNAYRNDQTCKTPPAFTSTKTGVTIGESGTAQVSSDPIPTPVPAGTYFWVASFHATSGNVADMSTSCGDENETSDVKPPEEPNFQIKKEQRLAGEANYTTAELLAEPGQTVEYLITVENTGNTSLKFGPLNDPKCTNIVPAGETELASGAKETFTCDHHLVAADKPQYTNVAIITGGGKEKPSEKVVVNVEEPEFTIIKEQRLRGEAAYTKALLKAEVGQVVEYLITVQNTSLMKIKFGPLKDPKCENIKPAGATELAGGAKETFTCEHTLKAADKPQYTNVATIEGNEKEKPSEKVVVEVEEPEFTIEKLQSLGGPFTKEKLIGKIGETVHYEIIVHNTGNVALEIEGFSDVNCTNLSGGTKKLAAGATTTWTCEHVLTTTGEYTNVGTVEANEEERESNKVVVEVPAAPNFTIEKLQEIRGSGGGFTKNELTGKVGQIVDYRLIVTNTGNTKLNLSNFTDANCSNVSGGAAELAIGGSTIFTCEHALATTGTWTNEGTITGTPPGGPPIIHTSNKVVVKVPVEAFTVEKLQKTTGEFTKNKLTAKVGEVVHYEIVVVNTGEATIKVEAAVDVNCTNLQGPTKAVIAPGEAAMYTCERTLTESGTFTNVAIVTGNEKPKESNPVVVEAAKQIPGAQCTINEEAIVIHGGTGSKRSPFTIHVPSLGIKEITFRLDGKKIKTLTSAQATNGQFTIHIDPRKLHYGAHTVSITTVMTDAACPKIARAAVFVRPRPQRVPPKFTG